MTREITMVSLIDGDDLNLEFTKAFANYHKAEDYFINLLKKVFPNDCEDWTKEDFESCLEDGYYQDLTHFCLYINQIVLDEED